MLIDNIEVGTKYKPFIIDEMSVNHNQSLERALKIVEAAADLGNNLYGVGFGNNTFVAVGSGKIVRSTDNGSSFDDVTSPTSNYLKGVTFKE